MMRIPAEHVDVAFGVASLFMFEVGERNLFKFQWLRSCGDMPRSEGLHEDACDALANLAASANFSCKSNDVFLLTWA